MSPAWPAEAGGILLDREPDPKVAEEVRTSR
jgi:hypothetical protein